MSVFWKTLLLPFYLFQRLRRSHLFCAKRGTPHCRVRATACPGVHRNAGNQELSWFLAVSYPSRSQVCASMSHLGLRLQESPMSGQAPSMLGFGYTPPPASLVRLWCARGGECDTRRGRLTGASLAAWLVASTYLHFSLPFTFCIIGLRKGERELVTPPHITLGFRCGWTVMCLPPVVAHLSPGRWTQDTHYFGMHLELCFFMGYKKRLCDTEAEAWNSMGISDTGHIGESICIFLILFLVLVWDFGATIFLLIFSARIGDTPGQNLQHDTPSGMELHLFTKGRKFTLDTEILANSIITHTRYALNTSHFLIDSDSNHGASGASDMRRTGRCRQV